MKQIKPTKREMKRFPDEMPITEMPFSRRLKNCLINEDIKTCGEIRQYSAYHFMRVPNLGRVSLMELQKHITLPLIDKSDLPTKRTPYIPSEPPRPDFWISDDEETW